MEQATASSTERLTLSVDETARLLGISRSFAYELCARHELPSVRLGRRLVVPRRALLRLIEEGTVENHGEESVAFGDVAGRGT